MVKRTEDTPNTEEGREPPTVEERVVEALERIAAALEQLAEQHGRGFVE